MPRPHCMRVATEFSPAAKTRSSLTGRCCWSIPLSALPLPASFLPFARNCFAGAPIGRRLHSLNSHSTRKQPNTTLASQNPRQNHNFLLFILPFNENYPLVSNKNILYENFSSFHVISAALNEPRNFQLVSGTTTANALVANKSENNVMMAIIPFKVHFSFPQYLIIYMNTEPIMMIVSHSHFVDFL